MEARTILNVKVIPGARKTMIKQEGELWKVHLNAPPVDGKANKALIEFLSDHWDIPKSKIAITKGLQSRMKTITIYKNFKPNP